MNSRVKRLGKMSIFLAESLGTGRFGSVFPGKLKDVREEVAIKKMWKERIQIDSNVYVKLNGKSNVIKYYGTDESTDDDKFM